MSEKPADRARRGLTAGELLAWEPPVTSDPEVASLDLIKGIFGAHDSAREGMPDSALTEVSLGAGLGSIVGAEAAKTPAQIKAAKKREKKKAAKLLASGNDHCQATVLNWLRQGEAA